MKRLITAVALSAAGLMTAALPTAGTALAQATAVEAITAGDELYQGERALYEQALKEGLVVSFDTGPTWANWAAEFAAFKKRYPGVEMTYNDLGSAATVVALDKARNRPQADTAYYFAASAFDAMAKDVVAPFKPVNFETLPEVFRDPDGNPNAGKLWLNFIMSAKGQAIFAEGYVRPSVPGVVLPADIAAKLPPAPQVRPLDVKAAAARKAAVDAGWTKAALDK